MPSRKYIERNVLEAKLPEGLSHLVKTVNPDEKAFMLIEKDMAAADGSGARRYQTIYVRRAGELAAFVRDLGEADKNVGEFVIPLAWEYSVAEADDLANEYRSEQTLNEKLLENAEKSNLVQQFHNLQEATQDIIKTKYSRNQVV